LLIQPKSGYSNSLKVQLTGKLQQSLAAAVLR
jgi:hypothetical protein